MSDIDEIRNRYNAFIKLYEANGGNKEQEIDDIGTLLTKLHTVEKDRDEHEEEMVRLMEQCNHLRSRLVSVRDAWAEYTTTDSAITRMQNRERLDYLLVVDQAEDQLPETTCPQCDGPAYVDPEEGLVCENQCEQPNAFLARMNEKPRCSCNPNCRKAELGDTVECKHEVNQATRKARAVEDQCPHGKNQEECARCAEILAPLAPLANEDMPDLEELERVVENQFPDLEKWERLGWTFDGQETECPKCGKLREKGIHEYGCPLPNQRRARVSETPFPEPDLDGVWDERD